MEGCLIRFPYDVDKFINAVAYFAEKDLPDLDKLKVSKLLYFADKLHLQKYSRTITGDDYRRIKRGPIPSRCLDIMNDAIAGEAQYFTDHEPEVEKFLKYVDIDDSGQYPCFVAKKDPDLDVFSRSDIEILDEVSRKYGNRTGIQLINLSHRDASWKKTKPSRWIDFRLFLEGLDQEEKLAKIQILEYDQEDRELFVL